MHTETQEEHSVSSPETEIPRTGKAVKKSGNRIGYYYIIIKSYKESQKNDVVKCLYIKSLTRFGFCVIKEGSCGDTKDKSGRDIIDRLRWQTQLHEQFQHTIPTPRLLGHFEENGNYYLVIEHIKGQALQRICSSKRKEIRQAVIHGGRLGFRFIGYLIRMASILETLHANRVVHRDATPNNYMIARGGKVKLIDMEMCYCLNKQYPLPAFQLGTYGYMSPQQEATHIPTTAEDIFALGAIIWQIWSGVSPGKITGDPPEAIERKVRFFITDKKIGDLVIQCLLPEDDKRPSAGVVRDFLTQYRHDLQYKYPRPAYQPRMYERKEILAAIQQTIDTLSTPLMADREKGWFADDMSPAPADAKHKIRKRWYASYDRGVSGILYALARAHAAGLDTSSAWPCIEQAIELIREKYINRIGQAKAGLHFGSDGIAACLATAIDLGLVHPTTEYLNWIGILLQKENTGTDMVKGAPGQGMALLASSPFLGTQMIKEKMKSLVNHLIGLQYPDGSWANGFRKQKWLPWKRKRVTRGFNEGMAGTIVFLLQYSYRYQDLAGRKAAIRGLAWLMRKARHKKGTITWTSAGRKELSYGWADGIAGIALAFIKAYQYTQKDIYKQYAQQALYSIPSDFTDGNLGQRSGLSGLGEIYLEAHSVFGDEEWFLRAGHLAQVIMHLKKQHPDHGSYWLVENERQPVANFMAGNSGVLHFLIRYCYPHHFPLPMMDRGSHHLSDTIHQNDKLHSIHEPATTA